MNQVVIIYNPASICSVIAAAHYMNHRQETASSPEFVKAFPAGNKIQQAADLFIWIGVEPSLSHLKQMAGTHIGYFVNPERGKHLQKAMTTFYPNVDVENETWAEVWSMLPDTVFKSILGTNFAIVNNSDTIEQSIAMPHWYIAKIAAEFEAGHRLDLEDQALVWMNYQASLRYLMNLVSEYNFTGYPSGIDIHGKPCYQPVFVKEILTNIVDMYRAELKTLKQQITMMFETSVLNIGGEAKVVPLINVDQTQAPFILRLLSHTYDYAVTYVQRRGVNIYTTFSRIAGFDEVLLKAVGAGSQKPQAMMSYQL